MITYVVVIDRSNIQIYISEKVEEYIYIYIYIFL